MKKNLQYTLNDREIKLINATKNSSICQTLAKLIVALPKHLIKGVTTK